MEVLRVKFSSQQAYEAAYDAACWRHSQKHIKADKENLTLTFEGKIDPVLLGNLRLQGTIEEGNTE